MSRRIDVSTWTDAQLEVVAKMTHRPEGKTAQDELKRRKAAGEDDGSRGRVDALLAASRPRRARRR